MTAPDWFERAIAEAPERRHVEVDGARIETLAWGQRGRPGLLFLHGNAATADLWRFVAPFFSGSHRVGALSWSGMGGSDWRATYSLDGFVNEIVTCARELGLFDGPGKPAIVAHSAGGLAALQAAHLHGDRFAAAVIVDTLVIPAGMKLPPYRGHRVYPTLAEALARFRFAPPQPTAHRFLVDLIARSSVHEVPGGWSWRFDPALFGKFPREGLAEMRCPIAYVAGEHSALLTPDRLAATRAALPAGTPFVVVPGAHHHVMVDEPIAFVSVIRTLLATYQGIVVSTGVDERGACS